MGKTFLGVRDVDEEELRKFKVLDVERRIRLGEAITKAMKDYTENIRNKKKRRTLGIY